MPYTNDYISFLEEYINRESHTPIYNCFEVTDNDKVKHNKQMEPNMKKNRVVICVDNTHLPKKVRLRS